MRSESNRARNEQAFFLEVKAAPALAIGNSVALLQGVIAVREARRGAAEGALERRYAESKS